MNAGLIFSILVLGSTFRILDFPSRGFISKRVAAYALKIRIAEQQALFRIRASETYYSISDFKRIGTKKCAFRRTIAMQVNILLKSGDFEGAKALAPSEFFFV